MNSDNLIQFFIGNHSIAGEYIPQANGEGIVSCSLDISTGVIRKIGVCQDEPNSTYLAKSTAEDILFVAGDRYLNPGQLSAFSIKSNGTLELLSSVAVPGMATCHVCCHPNGDLVYVSSYWDGTLTAHRFDSHSLSPPVKIVKYQGSGPNKERQESPHAHQSVVSPDGQWLFVCDLGSDRIWVHKANIGDDPGIIHETEVPPGYGPRHLVCHPELPLVFLLCELNGFVLTFLREKDGYLKLIKEQPSLPETYSGKPSAAAIRLHPSGKVLMVSNRGHHSITVFSVDPDKEYLNLESIIHTGGKDPRDFGIDPTGTWLLAANQNSDTIIPFRLNPETGLPTGEKGPVFDSGTPVCIEFA